MSDATVQPGAAPADAVSPVSDGRRMLTAREKIGLGALVLGGVAAVALWPAGTPVPVREAEQPLAEVGRSVPYRPMPPAEPAAQTVGMVVPGGGNQPMPTNTPLPMPGAVATRPGPSPIMSYVDGSNAPAADERPRGARQETDPAGALRAQPQQDDTMATRLRSSRLSSARATRMEHPELTVVQGTRIPCLPEQPIDSTVAGFFSCLVDVDVRGFTGNVVLMERGTRIVGEVRSALARGSRRLFVVMTQATTPTGVEISLDSPGADILGQAGLEGEVETHFFERFRGAMLLAFIDTGLQAAALVASNALAQERGGVSINQFQSGGRQAANTALESDINIPPTLRRNQAVPMTVFVARKLDFSGVYRLRAIP